MNNYRKVFTKIIFIVTVSILTTVFLCSVCFARQSKRLIVVGHVIGVEQPETFWAGEYQNVKIFYIRIDKTLRGKSIVKYIRIAYGYNPSSAPQYILPQEMFGGKTRWQFDLSEYSDFDAKVSLSKSENDWFDTENEKKVKINDLPNENALDKEKEFIITPIMPKCVPVVGYEKEATVLEILPIVRGYWLGFDKKSFKEVKE